MSTFMMSYLDQGKECCKEVNIQNRSSDKVLKLLVEHKQDFSDSDTLDTLDQVVNINCQHASLLGYTDKIQILNTIWCQNYITSLVLNSFFELKKKLA